MDPAVVEKIRYRVAEELGITADQVGNETSFESDLNADSLETIRILQIAEQEVGREIPEDQREGIHSLNDLMRVLG